MSKTELFDHILHLVAEETELPAGRILSKRRDTETVDARYLLVHFLSDTGFSPSYIAQRIGFTERAVQKIQTHFDERLSFQKLLRINFEHITNKLRTTSELPPKALRTNSFCS